MPNRWISYLIKINVSLLVAEIQYFPMEVIERRTFLYALKINEERSSDYISQSG